MKTLAGYFKLEDNVWQHYYVDYPRMWELTPLYTVAACPEAFNGFPDGPVSSSNADGKCVTVGETTPSHTVVLATKAASLPKRSTLSNYDKFNGVDIQFRCSGAGWVKPYRVRVLPSKNERAEMRTTVFCDTLDEAIKVAKGEDMTDTIKYRDAFPHDYATDKLVAHKITADGVAAVAPSCNWIPIDKNTPTGKSMWLINKAANSAQKGVYLPGEKFFDHWFPFPTFKKAKA